MAVLSTGKYRLATLKIMGYTIYGSVYITALAESGDNVKISYRLGWTQLNGTFSLEVIDYDSSHFIPYPDGGRFNETTIFTGATEFFFSKTFTTTIKQGASVNSIGFGIGWVGGTTGDGVTTVGANNFAWSGRFSSDTTAPVYYRAPTNFVITATNSTTDSITVEATWTEGTKDSDATITIDGKTGTIANTGESTTITGLSSNTKYSIDGSLNDTKTTLSASAERWTVPLLESVNLTLKSGLEHDAIDAAATPAVASSYDQFSFKLNTNTWSAFSATKTYSYSNLTENTEYTITAKMKNTESAYESAEKSNKITTWYDPISNLSVVLTNRWFWYLLIKSNYTYHGTISKYEFSIGNETYQNKGTTNSYSKGTTTPGNAANLAYNTDFTCKAKLTDNHGRTAEASATFKTLDERPLYVDGVLREVKVINSDGTVTYVTPNLLSVINSDGTITNMNKIINNDNRTQYQ